MRGGWDLARSLLGLTTQDEGSVVERVLATIITERLVNAHNRNAKQQG